MKRMIDNKEFKALKNEVDNIESDVNALIDDTATSSSKVWSSNKVNTELGQLKGMGVVYSTTATPTNEDNTFIFNKSDFITEPIPSWTSIIGKQICQIVDSKIKYIYSVVSSSESTITCVLIGEVGGGKQFYQHNVKIVRTNNFSVSGRNIIFTIVSTRNTAFTKSDLATWLYDKGYTSENSFVNLNYCYVAGSSDVRYVGISCTDGAQSNVGLVILANSGAYSISTFNFDNENYSVIDNFNEC